ncbi:MAG: hypothetical protein ABL931_09255 [Usitatibacteraceae bacterium]
MQIVAESNCNSERFAISAHLLDGIALKTDFLSGAKNFRSGAGDADCSTGDGDFEHTVDCLPDHETQVLARLFEHKYPEDRTNARVYVSRAMAP